MPLAVLIGCETSGTVRDVFRTLGHDAVSCDILPSKRPGPHLQMDVRLAMRSRRWDMFIAHPPCPKLTVAAAWTMYHPDDKHLPFAERRPHPKFPNRRAEQDEAAAFFLELAHCEEIPLRCIENPVGVMSTRYRPPDQIVQPYWYGDDASKKTGLHLYGLPPLPRPTPENWYPPRLVFDKSRGKILPRWSNQTDSGQNRLGPSPDRWDKRSATYPGIAATMGLTWGLEPLALAA